MHSRNRARRAFTLVELLIVIVVIAVLAGIVVFSIRGVSARGNKAACEADVRTVQTAVEAYYAQNGAWPEDIDAIVDAGLLRSAPSNSAYEITYDADSGAVASAPACSTLS